MMSSVAGKARGPVDTSRRPTHKKKHTKKKARRNGLPGTRFCREELEHVETMLDNTLRNEFQSCVSHWERGSFVEKMLHHQRQDTACALAKKSIVKIFRGMLSAAKHLYGNGPAGDVTHGAKQYLQMCSADDSDETCFARFLGARSKP
jgi:hypothetical protein